MGIIPTILSVKIDEDYQQSKLPSGCLESLVHDTIDEPNPEADQSILAFMSETIKSEWLKLDRWLWWQNQTKLIKPYQFPFHIHMYNKKSYDS